MSHILLRSSQPCWPRQATPASWHPFFAHCAPCIRAACSSPPSMWPTLQMIFSGVYTVEETSVSPRARRPEQEHAYAKWTQSNPGDVSIAPLLGWSSGVTLLLRPYGVSIGEPGHRHRGDQTVTCPTCGLMRRVVLARMAFTQKAPGAKPPRSQFHSCTYRAG